MFAFEMPDRVPTYDKLRNEGAIAQLRETSHSSRPRA